MAAQTQGAFALIDLSHEIVVSIPESCWHRYTGPRAALEAEGILPEEFGWPTGWRLVEWADEHFLYELRRKRPEGVKGPRKQFESLDYWSLTVWQKRRKSYVESLLEETTNKICDITFRQSLEGQRQWHAAYEAHCRARKDTAFQAFIGRLPIPQPKKRGRPARMASTAQENSHV